MSVSIRTIYEAEPNFPATDQHPDALRYRVGELWVDAVGGEPTPDQVAAVLTFRPVPQTVYLWQAKAALAAAGKLEAANAAIAGSGNELIQLAWAGAPQISRTSPSVEAMGAIIGLDAAAIDALFLAAAEISV